MRFCRVSQSARLVAFVCALVSFFATPAALASAPMCGEHAESIAAPLPLVPTREGEIRATPDCDNGSRLLRAPPPDRSHQLAGAEGTERALPLLGALPRCPRGALIERPAVDSSLVLVGFRFEVFRPPRT
jgi:hypothetical protein